MRETNCAAVMPRDGAIIFRDLVGKLDVLNVEVPSAAGEAGITRIG